jgi:pimeloyl-ACP methyl ester carboxylesterase
MNKLIEQAVLLGKQRSLVGVIAPALGTDLSDNPTIVILNTAIVHRVGHHRMFVTMSRALAQAGFSVLRFDFSGIGDSEPRSDCLPPLESALADLTDVLDWLEKDRRSSRVILVGLCSGADHAVLHARNDPRVVGLVLIDPWIPPTARFYFEYITKRLTRLRSWTNLISRPPRIHRLSVRKRPGAGSRPLSLSDLSVQYLEQSYHKAIGHRIQILAIFSDDAVWQSYPEQMIDAFPKVSFGSQLKREFLRESDHTFTREKDRAMLIELVVSWVKSTVYREPSPG